MFFLCMLFNFMLIFLRKNCPKKLNEDPLAKHGSPKIFYPNGLRLVACHGSLAVPTQVLDAPNSDGEMRR